MQQKKGWKLFVLLPRMLLSRSRRGRKIPRKKWEKTLRSVLRWSVDITDRKFSQCISNAAATAYIRKRRRRRTDGRSARGECCRSWPTLAKPTLARKLVFWCLGHFLPPVRPGDLDPNPKPSLPNPGPQAPNPLRPLTRPNQDVRRTLVGPNGQPLHGAL